MERYPDFSKATVLVVGDVMIDRYFWGDVSRISPEAPVPVVLVKEKTWALGGAGNVVSNLSGLGCRCLLLGICGDDPSGKHLVSQLDGLQVSHHLIKTAERLTTTKTRIIGAGQQIVRLDDEENGLLDENVYRRLFSKFKELLRSAGVVIISDYGKGLFNKTLAADIIRESGKSNVPVFVDPKGTDWRRYKGATCITPNTKEFVQVALYKKENAAALAEQAGQLMTDLDLSYLLITKGAQGVSLFGRDKADVHISSQAREVFDVSGAGDTVIATLASAFALGLTMQEAAELANMAAGIVVGKMGTQPILNSELEWAFYDKGRSNMNKILSLLQAKAIISKWRSQGNRIVFTNGCFDILHVGHIKLLNAAAEEGDRLVVGLNSDSSIRRLKGPNRPVMLNEDRAAILSSIKSVDLVVIFEEDTPIHLIETFQPDVLVKGGDYSPKTVVGHELVEKSGGEVCIIPLMEGVSTTRIVEKLKNRS